MCSALKLRLLTTIGENKMTTTCNEAQQMRHHENIIQETVQNKRRRKITFIWQIHVVTLRTKTEDTGPSI